MRKLSIMLGAIMALGLLVVGCSDQIAPTTSYQNLSAVTLPASASIDSATLYIYVNQTNGQRIDVHRVTAAWDEETVTWNNFGSSFDPTIVNSFTADAVDWRTVDITSLVTGWANGEFENHGLLLDQIEQVFPRARFNSKDNAENHPFVKLCYSTPSGSFCEEVSIDADAYVWEIAPDHNFGLSEQLFTGWQHDTDLEKNSLLWFEITIEPDDVGCTRTIGYYKTHAGFGPQEDVVTDLLPVTLGDDGDDKSLEVTSAAMAVDVLKMNTYGSHRNGITKLYAQLLAAKFNIINGASDGDVADLIEDADEFLATHDHTDWRSLNMTERGLVKLWQEMFDSYNNGEIGPGHCEDSYSNCDGGRNSYKRKHGGWHRGWRHHRH